MKCESSLTLAWFMLDASTRSTWPNNMISASMLLHRTSLWPVFMNCTPRIISMWTALYRKAWWTSNSSYWPGFANIHILRLLIIWPINITIINRLWETLARKLLSFLEDTKRLWKCWKQLCYKPLHVGWCCKLAFCAIHNSLELARISFKGFLREGRGDWISRKGSLH